MAASLALVVVLLLPANEALADEVLPREAGYVSISAGPRLLRHTSFKRRMDERDIPMSHSAVQPGLLLGFGYKIDHNWVVAIEAGGGFDRVHLEPGHRLDLLTLSLQISGQYVIPLGPDWFEPYLHAGVGYWLSNVSDVTNSKTDSEGITQGLSSGAGLRIAVGRGFGVVLDGRWIWSRQPTLEHGPITVGGGLMTVGLQYMVRGGDER